MSTHSVAVSVVISAKPAELYAALADYREAHPKIVPPAYFGPLIVEAGGTGEGTRFRTSLKLLGQATPFVADVTEPDPGRVLTETIAATGVVTSFTIVQQAEHLSRVTIETHLPRGAGLRGLVERLLVRRLFPRIYVEELGRLAAHVGGTIVGAPDIARAG
ncbi:MAG: SRPBCC family protein [bacterium]